MRGRTKLVALTASAVGVAGLATGAIAATGGGPGDPAADLAAAINKRAGTSISAADIQAAFKDLLKTRLDNAVAEGRITQAQADQILQRAESALPLGPFPPMGPFRHHGRHGGPRAEILAPVAKLLKLSEADLRSSLRAGSSLAQVADKQGVSRADLVAAIKKALTSSRAGIPSQELDALAARIADRTGPGPGGRDWHPGGFGAPPGAPPAAPDGQYLP